MPAFTVSKEKKNFPFFHFRGGGVKCVPFPLFWYLKIDRRISAVIVWHLFAHIQQRNFLRSGHNDSAVQARSLEQHLDDGNVFVRSACSNGKAMNGKFVPFFVTRRGVNDQKVQLAPVDVPQKLFYERILSGPPPNYLTICEG